ncbi:HAD family hydrolase [Prosthecomicrobium sp. N25]|uniref:HAD family hydrolase n=1 Tax=Prosthecomicrobium sp. N25 TaxID=3129254 RepID=UPI003077A310
MSGPAPTTVLVFDLDDTLYLERDFARSGFGACGRWLEAEHGLSGFADRCAALLEAGRRGTIFDEALAALGRPADKALVAKLVEVYRGHTPEIALAEDARRYFAQAHPGRAHAIISDGPHLTQAGKVRALGLDRLVGLVLLTDAWGRDYWKPHPRAFEAVEAWSGLTGPRLAYVADNPTKDFVTPKARGWHTIQILRGGRVHSVEAPDESHQAESLVTSLDSIDRILTGLGTEWANEVGDLD